MQELQNTELGRIRGLCFPCCGYGLCLNVVQDIIWVEMCMTLRQ